MFKTPPSHNWLVKALDLEGNSEVSAGPEIHSTVAPEEGSQPESHGKVQEAFSILMRNMRLERNISVEELAHTINVDAEQLHRVERRVGYKPPPRTLQQLAVFHQIPFRVLIQMAGAAKTIDARLENDAVSFAAKSESFEKLTPDERKVLNEFVKAIRDLPERKA